MKKIKINIAALAIRDASRNFGGQEPLLIKLSLAEAMDFAGNFSSFEEMISKLRPVSRLTNSKNSGQFFALLQAAVATNRER